MPPEEFGQPGGRNTTDKPESQHKNIRIIFSQAKDAEYFKSRALLEVDFETPLFINVATDIRRNFPYLRSELELQNIESAVGKNITGQYKLGQYVSGDTALQFLYAQKGDADAIGSLNNGPQFIYLSDYLEGDNLPALLLFKDNSPQPRFLVFIPRIPKDLVEQHKINLDTISDVLKNHASDDGSHVMVVAENTPGDDLPPHLRGASHHILRDMANVQSNCEMPHISFLHYVSGKGFRQYTNSEFATLVEDGGIATNNAGSRQAIKTGFFNFGQGSLVSEDCSFPSDHLPVAPKVLTNSEYFEEKMVDIKDEITALWKSAKKLEDQGIAHNPGFDLLSNHDYLPMLYAIKKLNSRAVSSDLYSPDTYKKIASIFSIAFEASSKTRDGKDIGFEDRGIARAKRFLKVLAEDLDIYKRDSLKISDSEKEHIQLLIRSVELQIDNIESIPERESENMAKDQKRIAEFMAKVDQSIQDFGNKIHSEKLLIEKGDHTLRDACSNLHTEFLKIPTVEKFQDMSCAAIHTLLGDAADLVYHGYPKQDSVAILGIKEEDIKDLFLAESNYKFNMYDYGKGCNTKDALPQRDIVLLKLEDKDICTQCKPGTIHHIVFPEKIQNLADVVVLNDDANSTVRISCRGTDGRNKKSNLIIANLLM